ncbi:hypothetical protein [Burkholderia ubonensis]|uniref:hypothetical protein n=1 Tax=Burkholderia ubonensis TaxID=101571 RepID=UPI000753EDD0|nr:hypothetical protein [Burkholderia ubonensis]
MIHDRHIAEQARPPRATIAPAPERTERPRALSTPSRLEHAPSSAQSLAAAPPVGDAMYEKSGTLNYQRMGAVLHEMKRAVRQLDPDSGRGAEDKIDRILKSLRTHRGPELYHALKQLSFAIKRESKAEGMQALSAAVLQMARTHNYQLGLSKYDDVARTIGKQTLASNPNIDKRSQSYASDVTALEIRGSAKIGVQLGAAEAGAVSAGVTAGVSRSGMVTTDLDMGSLFISLGRANVNASLDAAVGRIAGNALGTMAGGISVNSARGRMFEGTRAEEVIGHKVMHDREGGAFLTSSIEPSRETLEARANLATRGVTGRAAALLRSAKARFTEGRFADLDPELNTHKLVKGAVAEGYLFGPGSLLDKYPACAELSRHLASAYGTCSTRDLPSSLKPAVGSAEWIDVSGGVTANMGLLNGQVADYAKVTGLGVAGGLTYNHRWLPYQAWMAPHAALDALADRSTEAKEALLERVLAADPSLTPYLDETRTLSVQDLRTHMATFEEHAMHMLSAQGILRGYAHTPPDLSPPRILLDHASSRFNASLEHLKGVFHLSEGECVGVKPHSNKLEGLLARCWNRLSLSLAQTSLRPDADTTALRELAQRIEQPNILMAPEHLYRAATVQMEKTFMRSRVVGSVSLALPTVEVGSKTDRVGVSLGTLSGQATFDRVSEHPNFVRNGDFLTFDLTAQHPLNLDIANAAPRAIATAIAERLQAGGDKREIGKLDQASLLASMSQAYVTLGTDAANGAVSGTKIVQRQFEISAHRSTKSEPWRLMYIQASNIKNSGVGASADAAVALGVGGSVGGSVTRTRSDNLVMPPILGSAPSVHLLQAPRFAAALLEQEGGHWQIAREKLDFDKLRHTDVATMYFSNDSVLDMLDLLHRLKVDGNANADVLSGLANLGHNTTQFAKFQGSGMSAETLRTSITAARDATEGVSMADRLKYFTDHPTGRQLLQEYGAGVMQFAAMKSRAVMPYSGTDGRAMKPSIRTASQEKTPLEMPEAPARSPFSRDSAFRRGIRRAAIANVGPSSVSSKPRKPAI